MASSEVSKFRQRLYEIIFEAETPSGKAFDVILLWGILLSVGAVLLESVESYGRLYGKELRILEWVLTGLFTLEYIVRVICVRRPTRYIFSFFGIVDLLSIIPTYFSLFFFGTHSLLVIRGLRLLRVFRVFKLGRYTGEAKVLLAAIQASRPKITVFLGGVLGLVLTMGAVMYLVEGAESGFTSIPRAMYWAIVTMTTVGYGDIVPQTALGQLLASAVMICGYAIIAVPTGIVSVELANVERQKYGDRVCKRCSRDEHQKVANYCVVCGEKL